MVIARYLKNIDLTRALYPSLHAFEVAFRNALSAEIVDEYGPRWYVDHDFRNWVEEKGCDALDEAIERLEDASKTLAHSDRIVAQLTLGFWVNLISRKREQFWMPRLSRILPDAEPSDRNMKQMRAKFSRTHRLRNRAFHHEPLFFDEKLGEKHKAAREQIRWMNAKLDALLDGLDHFPETFDLPLSHYIDQVEAAISGGAPLPPPHQPSNPHNHNQNNRLRRKP